MRESDHRKETPEAILIICHKYEFIFLKTRKTAGSSIELALASLCSDGDVITPMVSEGVPGQNFLVPRENWTIRAFHQVSSEGSNTGVP